MIVISSTVIEAGCLLAPSPPNCASGGDIISETQNAIFLETRRADGICGRGYCWRHRHRQRNAGEFCRQDVTGHMTSCGYSTMQQCKDTSAGIGGDCFRDPKLGSSNPSNAFAMANRRRPRSGERGLAEAIAASGAN